MTQTDMHNTQHLIASPLPLLRGGWGRFIAGMTLAFFTWFNVHPAVAAVKEELEKPSAAATKVNGDEQRQAVEQLEATLNTLIAEVKPARDLVIKRPVQAGGRTFTDITILDRPEAPRVQEQQHALRELAESLQQQDRQTLDQFERDKDHLIKHQLPDVIFARHEQAVRDFKQRAESVQAQLAALQDATTAVALYDQTQALLEQLNGWKPKRAKLDPNNLPFRAAEDKVRAPITDPEQLRQLLGTSDAKQKVPTVASRAEVLPSAQRRVEVSADQIASINATDHAYPLERTEIDVASTGDVSGLVKTATVPPPGPEYLAETEDVQITDAIRAKAEELHNNPVEIYNWVHNNVEYLPSYGSIQGSDLTLQNLRGNAFDTASLLIALLRAAGTPARYVYGAIEVPIDQAMNWVGGVTTPEAAQQLMGQGGIPNAGLAQGGVIKAIRLEHVWVEAFVDYYPSRGARNLVPDAWVPMDASFKQHDVVAPAPLPQELSINHAEEIEALANVLTVDPATGGLTQLYPEGVGYMFAQDAMTLSQTLDTMDSPPTADALLGEVRILPAVAGVIAASAPWKLTARVQSYANLPSNLRHVLTLGWYPTSNDLSLASPVSSYVASLPVLSNKRIGLSYDPATEDDRQAWDSYGDMSSVPVYLIYVVPRLSIDDVVVVQGSPSTLGVTQYWGASISDPQHQNDHEDIYSVVAGSFAVFGLNSALVSPGSGTKRDGEFPADSSVSENLHRASLNFWAQYDLVDDMRGSVMNVQHVRLPSIGQFSRPLTVQYRYGVPNRGFYGSYLADIKRILMSVVAHDSSSRFRYITSSGFDGSLLEAIVFEQLTGRFFGPGNSTTRILLDAAGLDIPIVYVDQSNVDLVLPDIELSEETKTDVVNFIESGKIVVVSQQIPYQTAGYLVQDPETGGGAYLIDSGANGGELLECEKVALPLAQAVREVVLTSVALRILAIEAASFAGSVTSAAVVMPLPLPPPAQAILFALLMALGLEAMSESARTGTAECDCVLESYPQNRGGQNDLHDYCANYLVPPDGNEFSPNGAVFCDEKEPTFDAVNGGQSTLWEVKTNNWSKYNEYTSLWEGSKAIAQFEKQSIRARQCGKRFKILFGDEDFLQYMIDVHSLNAKYIADEAIVNRECRQP